MRSIQWILIIVLLVFITKAYSAPGRPELIPLGDSITDGTLNYGTHSFGYRQPLQDELGIDAYRFKGQFKSGSGRKYQKAHSGVIGETNSEIEKRLPKNLSLFSQLKLSKPSVILIHAGTNDLAWPLKTDAELDEYVAVLDRMVTTIHEFSRNIDVYVALIIPSRGEPRSINIQRYNAKVAAMVKAKGYPNVYTVDMNTAFEKDTFGLCKGDWSKHCMFDNLHPNYAGYEVMGKQWAACIKDPKAKNCNGN